MKFLHVHRYLTGAYTHAHDRDEKGARWLPHTALGPLGHVHPDLADLELYLAAQERKEAAEA